MVEELKEDILKIRTSSFKVKDATQGNIKEMIAQVKACLEARTEAGKPTKMFSKRLQQLVDLKSQFESLVSKGVSVKLSWEYSYKKATKRGIKRLEKQINKALEQDEVEVIRIAS